MDQHWYRQPFIRHGFYSRVFIIIIIIKIKTLFTEGTDCFALALVWAAIYDTWHLLPEVHCFGLALVWAAIYDTWHLLPGVYYNNNNNNNTNTDFIY